MSRFLPTEEAEYRARIVKEVDDCHGNRKKIKAIRERERLTIQKINDWRGTWGSRHYTPRHFSAADKLRILDEWLACSRRGDVNALVEAEHITHALLSKWRNQWKVIKQEAAQTNQSAS